MKFWSLTTMLHNFRSTEPFLTIFASFERGESGLSNDISFVKNGYNGEKLWPYFVCVEMHFFIKMGKIPKNTFRTPLRIFLNSTGGRFVLPVGISENIFGHFCEGISIF